MRVVSGKYKGRKLESVPGDSTRPILSRLRQSLFDGLGSEIEGASFLDLFAGTGSVGIEALSRGASHVTFVDIEKLAVQTIKKNLHHLDGLHDLDEKKSERLPKVSIHHMDAFSFLRNCQRTFDFIFIAPPQYLGIATEALGTLAERVSLLAGICIVQVDPKEWESVVDYKTLERIRDKRYGNTQFVFYCPKTAE